MDLGNPLLSLRRRVLVGVSIRSRRALLVSEEYLEKCSAGTSFSSEYVGQIPLLAYPRGNGKAANPSALWVKDLAKASNTCVVQSFAPKVCQWAENRQPIKFESCDALARHHSPLNDWLPPSQNRPQGQFAFPHPIDYVLWTW